ncbi:hypothetical protein SAMN04488511_102208 [Pedobacter suwonensis]|uniref:Arm DNA-binding domain-containing protein n=1 Tax=Pedobacter suwonensis TaxID=332999 RepID=A0A1I0SNG2_9SPHI|nr:hypothetical protein [Pedobacter suwonensis]SFA40963.1 hypothetical protein SAMN04488511_102208 [Pedobacter suwonensis]
MATVSTTIIKGGQKSNGTWNVKIRVWHKKQSAYIDTIHFVNIKQLWEKSPNSDSLIIKNKFILKRIAADLRKYREWIGDNEHHVAKLSAKHVRDKLVNLKKGDLTEIER